MNPISIEAMVLPELEPAGPVRVAAEAGFDSVGLWVDPATWPPRRISFAQICDAGPAPVDLSRAGLLDEARHHRRVIGEGGLPLCDYLFALPPGIRLSIESRSRAAVCAFPDPLHRAKMHAASLRRLLERADGR